MNNLYLLVAGVLVASTPFASAQLVRQENTTLNLPPELPTATGYTTENALGTLTFSAPMCAVSVQGETNRLFVAERSGTIQVVTNLSTTPAKSLYLSLSSILGTGEALNTNGENGFLSLVFHPNFASNGSLFVYYSVRDSDLRNYQRLHRVTVSSPASNAPTIVSHTPLLTIYDRETNHNGGDLHFGSDGYLYLSLGDEGASNDSRNNARFINHRFDASVQRTGFWGQLLRLDVDLLLENLEPNPHVQDSVAFPSAVHAGTYKIPADNPLIGYTLWHSAAIDPATVRTEIYATGLRNPFRWSFDSPTGRLFLGDVGQNAWEEVDIVEQGDDLGWSWREGLHAFTSAPAPNTPPPAPGPGDPPGTGFSPIHPIYEYDRTNNGTSNDSVIYGTSITGGRVYRGNRLTELFGAYIFSDYNTGFIAALREQPNGTWTGQRLATDNNLVHFGEDPRNGDVIFCDLGSGTVKRLTRTGTSGAPPPATLSATGAFSNLATLSPQPGIVAYTPNVAFWSDYATKSRWFSIKNLTDTVGFNADGNWAFPAGMVWIKHFDIETTRGDPATKRKLETRFLVKTADAIYGLVYKWRADQTDADLVGEAGLNETIPGSSPSQTWRYPSRAECMTCHTPVAGHALSFNTRQLNRDHTHGAVTQNQIQALSDAGYFSAAVAGIHNLPALVSAADTSQSLEARVRSYLAVNCVQCHQPGGASQGNWNARPQVPTDAAGLINGLLINPGADPANRFAVPGDTAHSMVVARLQGAGVPRMPPLATNELDPTAIQLLTDWITQDLPERQSFSQWQTTHFGSPGNPLAAPGEDPDGDGRSNQFEFLSHTDPNDATSGFSISGPTMNAGQFQFDFLQPANRAALVETSTDLADWVLWDAPGNAPHFPAVPEMRAVTAPLDGERRFFRLQLLEQ